MLRTAFEKSDRETVGRLYRLVDELMRTAVHVKKKVQGHTLEKAQIGRKKRIVSSAFPFTTIMYMMNLNHNHELLGQANLADEPARICGVGNTVENEIHPEASIDESFAHCVLYEESVKRVIRHTFVHTRVRNITPGCAAYSCDACELLMRLLRNKKNAFFLGLHAKQKTICKVASRRIHLCLRISLCSETPGIASDQTLLC
jgi:hypothetical protein